MGALAQSGFCGLYDFCYVPLCFESGHSLGFAFVNFRSASAAGSFYRAWHQQRWLGAGEAAGLNVSAAKVQGLEANLERWNAKRLRRIKNPDFLPFVAPAATEAPAGREPLPAPRPPPAPRRAAAGAAVAPSESASGRRRRRGVQHP